MCIRDRIPPNVIPRLSCCAFCGAGLLERQFFEMGTLGSFVAVPFGDRWPHSVEPLFSACAETLPPVPSLCQLQVLHAHVQSLPSCIPGKNCLIYRSQSFAVREFVNKSAASAASLDYVKFQAVIKSAASAASLRGGRASGRLDHGLFFAIFGRASGQKIAKNSQNLGL